MDTTHLMVSSVEMLSEYDRRLAWHRLREHLLALRSVRVDMQRGILTQSIFLLRSGHHADHGCG